MRQPFDALAALKGRTCGFAPALVVVGVLLGAAHSATAQTVELTPFLGYRIGGGLKVFFNEHYGARFDGRASTGFGNSGAGVNCGFGGCGLSFGGWGSWHGEAAVGFVFAF